MLLSLPKKAVSEKESDDILTQTMNLPRPFGVPTLVLRQEHLPDRKTILRKSGDKHALARFLIRYLNLYTDADLPADADGTKLRFVFRRAMENHHLDLGVQNALSWFLQNQTYICNSLKSDLATNFNAVCQRSPTAGFTDFAHKYPSGYTDPVFSLVVAPRADADIHKMLQTVAANIIVPRQPLPGYRSQWQTFVMWHEYAHGCGAGEVQADHMATIMCRKAFADQRFLRVWSDIRAIHAVRQATNTMDAVGNHYPWPIVGVTDQVLAMDQIDIDVMQEDDIKALRFRTHKLKLDAITSVGSAVDSELRSMSDWTDGYFKATLRLLNRGVFTKPQEHQIAKRFLLAAARLSRGGDIYNQPLESYAYKPGQ